jgi:LPXTG-motif cell wall-anchored protein
VPPRRTGPKSIHCLLGDPLRRFLPSPRRIRNIVGAGAVGIAVAAAFATPAFACDASLGKHAACGDESGTVKVTWTLTTNDDGAVLSDVGVNAGTLTGDIANGKAMKSGVTLTGIQTLKYSEGHAQLDVKLSWHGYTWTPPMKTNVLTFDGQNLPSKCEKGEGGGGGGTPAPITPVFTSTCDSVIVKITNPRDKDVTVSITGVDKPVTIKAHDSKTVTIKGTDLAKSNGVVEVKEGKAILGTTTWTASTCESPSPSASVPASGVAGASSSASGALPVTGSNTVVIAGTALVLLAAGGGLFFVARRRRIKFTA